MYPAPHIYLTLKIGYGIRIAQSFGTFGVPLVIFIDFGCGMISLNFVDAVLGHSMARDAFVSVLATTLVQGLLLNLFLLFTLLLIYPVVRCTYRTKQLWDATEVCVNCGYDLRASKLECPECGHPIPTRG